jgi:tetratricopeptide (TPR) repeat protein
MLAPLYQNQKKYSAASGLYRQLVSSQPKLGQNWMGLATNLDALGDYKNALQAYQRAVQLGLNSVALQKYANERMRKLAQQAGANAGT